MAKMSLGTMILKMSEGLGTTCGIFFLTLLFSLPLGLVVTLLRRSRLGVVRGITKVYISIMRGTPLMLQLMVVYYGPFYLSKWISKTFDVPFRLRWSGDVLVPIIIGFVLNYAAYFAEIYRSGIESIPVGQYEAAQVLGYSRPQTFLRIVLPQVVKRVLPSVTNEVITLVKDTSLAFTLGCMEMFTLGKSIANSQSKFTPFVIAGVFYYVFNALVAFVMARLERRLNYYR